MSSIYGVKDEAITPIGTRRRSSLLRDYRDSGKEACDPLADNLVRPQVGLRHQVNRVALVAAFVAELQLVGTTESLNLRCGAAQQSLDRAGAEGALSVHGADSKSPSFEDSSHRLTA